MFNSKEILNELIKLNALICVMIEKIGKIPGMPNKVGRPKKIKSGWPKGKKRGPKKSNPDVL